MAGRQHVAFASQGNTLSGALETPADPPRCYALFAHCFTCGKDIAAASRIARALTDAGIAVLRFDFTGLGNSDGDFANSNFSSNVQDLLAAADFLREHHKAPELLIGHSLGGSATLLAADGIPEARAVVTIGAPCRADHLLDNFHGSLAEIEDRGEARVTLGRREFTIRRQFLDDLRAHGPIQLSQLRKALLVMHSPVDNIVSIDEAEKIYLAARHPKSFVSLNDADHLLSRRGDTNYVARTIAAWADPYLSASAAPPRPRVEKGHLQVEERDHRFALDMFSDTHHWLADEPTSLGGSDRGPDPYEHLLAALGACTAMTLRMYAARKEIPLEHVSVDLSHRREYVEDCEDCDDKGSHMHVLHREVRLQGPLTEAQRTRLMEIADRCPVHRTLHGPLRVATTLLPPESADI